MDRRRFVLTSLAGVLVAPSVSVGQQAARVWRVGILATVHARQISGPIPSDRNMRALVQRLSELGWAFGQNFVTEPRGADGRLDALAALADDLARAGVDVIVTTGGNPAALAAKRAAPGVPIVMANSGDPVGAGLVASLARPGGNITGISMDAGPEIYAKRLGFLKDAAPRITRVGVIARKGGHEQPWRTTLSVAAETARLSLVYATVAAEADYSAAFTQLLGQRVDSLLVSDSPLNFHNQPRIIDFAARQRLPAVYAFRETTEAGGLLSYGIDFVAAYRRAAEYVDRILRGKNPADLPIEQPTTFELVINLKTAKALGLTMPNSLLLRADHVIE